MQYNIAVIKGDGIGPEIVTEAMKALEVVGEKFGHTFQFTECYAGGNAIDKYGIPLPQETLDICKASDSVLLGAVGGAVAGGQPQRRQAGNSQFRRAPEQRSVPPAGAAQPLCGALLMNFV